MQSKKVYRNKNKFMKTQLWLMAALLLVGRSMAADAKPARRLAREQAMAPAGAMGFERVLTDAQRQQMRDYIQEQTPDFRESMQKLGQLRRELQEAVLAGKADEKVIKEKTDAIGKLESEQLRVRMAALAKVASTFTADQKEKIKEMSERPRAARPGLRPRRADGEAPGKAEPAAPPPADK